MTIIDLRSDTVTQPTSAMRKAMFEAPLGDDNYQEDPLTKELEAQAATLLGKEAGLLVTSGHQGNLVSILTHCNRGDEMIVGNTAHIYLSEVGSASGLGGVHPRAVLDRGCIPTISDVEDAIRTGYNIHWPNSALLCLENTHNFASGTPTPPEKINELADLAHANQMKVHIDGARLFNAAVYFGIPAHELAAQADSVTFCLSKGLSCPLGSLICGTKEFVSRARKIRKMLGGGMRQSGFIAAAGLVALETMINRLAEDHDNAKRLAVGLAAIPGIDLDPDIVKTNIVYFEVPGTVEEFCKELQTKDVLCNSYLTQSGKRVRMVTHYGLTAEDVDAALEAIESVVMGKRVLK